MTLVSSLTFMDISLMTDQPPNSNNVITFKSPNQTDDDFIGTVLDVEANLLNVSQETISQPALTDPLEDFKMSHENTKKLIAVGLQAVDQLSNIAAQSQHPRDFEVLFDGIDKLVSIQEKFLGLKMQENEDGQNKNPTTVNMVITTSELLRMMKKAEDNKNEPIDITPTVITDDDKTS